MTEPIAPRPDVPYVPGVETPQLFGHPSTWPQVDPAMTESPPVPVAPVRRKASVLWIALLAGAIVLVSGGVALATAAAGIGPVAGMFKDSGVAACETIRDNAAASQSEKKASPSVTPSSDKAAEAAAYLKWRKAFADSRHEDLRVAGTAALDMINQLAGAGQSEDDLGLALAMVGQLVEKWSALAGACANHGVVIPKLTEMSGQ
ncbi:hypothetical protein ACQEVZ_24955 [Dactylosporangium sp. CA-152071]|uniref:hypothetical protein n=1 Tax=Dactylosporangium sp. CA-152071 TaxID=3239933 RepID=UPI003D8E8C60